MKSMKFLLMFVLMLSIASVNVDAQFDANGHHKPTMNRYDNALKYARENVRSDLQLSYVAKQLIAVGNHLNTAAWIANNYFTYPTMAYSGNRLEWTYTSTGNGGRCQLTNRSRWDPSHEIPIEWTVGSNGMITRVWYGYGTYRRQNQYDSGGW